VVDSLALGSLSFATTGEDGRVTADRQTISQSVSERLKTRLRKTDYLHSLLVAVLLGRS
jgi:hypothetical protein